jgi:hypothetical protein
MLRKSLDDDQYRDIEAQQRFEAALRGARLTDHKPMKSMTPKRPKKQRKLAKKQK